MIRIQRFLALGTLILLSSLIGAIPTFAHANLVRSEPAANEVLANSPTRLRLWFSETPEPGFSQIRLLDRARQEVPGLGAIQVDASDNKLLIVTLPTLQPGVYTVAWKALSAVDGHTTAGGFAFVVGLDQVPTNGLLPTIATTTSSTPNFPGTTIRWLTYVSLALLIGGFAFVPLILQPALRKAESLIPKGQQPQQQPRPFSHTSGLFAVLIISLVLLTVATIAQAIMQTASVGSQLLPLLTGTRFGLIFWFRVALLAVVAGLIIFRQSGAWRSSMAQNWWRVGVLAGVLLALTVSLNSHGAALNTIAFALDWLHLSAIGLWLGGLVTLLLALRWLRHERPDSALQTSAVLISRFSQIASVSLLLILLTGIGQGVFQVANIWNLLDTEYGLILLVKIALFLPLLVIAALNFVLTNRRINRAIKAGNESADSDWLRIIRRTVTGEVLFIAGVLVVTGVLTMLPPSREAFGGGVVVRSQADDIRVIVAINPGIPGLNTYDIYLKDGLGRPISETQKVALQFASLDMDMGITEAVAQPAGDGATNAGHYVVNGNYISMAGGWQIDVIVRRNGRDDVKANIRFGVLDTVPEGFTLRITPTVLLGIELMIAGGITIVGSRRLRWANARVGRWAVDAGAVVVLVGIIVAVNGIITAGNALPTANNPVPADAASIERGKTVYTANCVPCHGEQGRGDGPAGVALNPHPADFRVHMAAGHTDASLFQWISNGIPNSAMPAFGGRLTETERWDVINYIRTFAGQP